MTHSPVKPTARPAEDTTPPQPATVRTPGGLARVARTVAGALLLLVGAAMLVLPGPGLLVIVAGLSSLAVDYVWARRLQVRASQRLTATGRTIRHAVKSRRTARRRNVDEERDGLERAGHGRTRHTDSHHCAENPPTVVSS